jgi:multidrug efflux pump subunit AcrB
MAQFLDLCAFAENVIRKRIEQLPEVAMVDMSGIVKPQVGIEPDMEKLTALNISLGQLEAAIAANNINPGSLAINDGHYQYNIRFSTVLRNSKDIGEIYLKINDKVLQLKDVARISTDTQKQSGMYTLGHRPAIAMAVIKQADAKLSEMKDKIKELVSTLEADYPDIHFEASQDQAQLLDYSISNLKQNLGQGLLLVILVVFLFLKDFKSPLLIGMSLLVSMVICMLFFRLIGLSVNIISLAGLILAVGNMIDNSIVIIDNINQYKERGLPIENACVKGTNEVMVPMLSSLLTNVAVFVPMIFLSGIAGALIYDQAMSVVIGLSVSYLVGITLMPVVFRIIYHLGSKTPNWPHALKRYRFFRFFGNLNINDWLVRNYEKGLDFTFRRKKLNAAIYLSAIPIGLLLLLVIRKEKMPEFPQVETIIKIEWNQNIYIGENQKRVSALLDLISEKTLQSNSFIGQQQFLMNYDQQMSASESKIYIKTGSPQDVEWINKLAGGWIKKNYPMAEFGFEAPTSIFEKLFTSSEPPLVAEISLINKGSEWDLSALAGIRQQLGGKSQLQLGNEIPLQENVMLNVDLEKLLLYNVSYGDLIKEIKTAFKENFVGTLKSYQQYLPMVFTGKARSLSSIIENLQVLNAKKEPIPVKYFLAQTKTLDLKTIVAGKEGEYIPLAFYPESIDYQYAMQQISTVVKKSGMFDLKFSGAIFSSAKLLKEMGLILIVSVLLLYFILAAQFESLVQPFIVLIELPIDFAGALLVLFLMGESLNLMSAIGIVIMSGIIINDSILKIDVINQLRKQGLGIKDAIREGGHRRLRAILMTSLTSVLAMLPLLFSSDLGSELQKPFALALIGGMALGTIVSLYFLPLVYWVIYRKSERSSVA